MWGTNKRLQYVRPLGFTNHRAHINPVHRFHGPSSSNASRQRILIPHETWGGTTFLSPSTRQSARRLHHGEGHAPARSKVDDDRTGWRAPPYAPMGTASRFTESTGAIRMGCRP
jgi:hypothetical protein